LAITAEALNTITSPMKTSSTVTVKRVLSTLTRLAIALKRISHHQGTEAQRILKKAVEWGLGSKP
jgi:hypothetical protein